MDFLGKGKREECNSERECKFMEVKVATQSYDWSGPIAVIEQRDCGSGMGSHPVWMSAEVAEGIPRV